MAFIKDPDAVLDYGFDWSDWLAAGETIVSSAWAADSSDITIDSDTFGDTSATVWLSGGTVGTEYKLTNHIVTSAGREDDRTIVIKAKER